MATPSTPNVKVKVVTYGYNIVIDYVVYDYLF
jgi:hypothetical protein